MRSFLKEIRHSVEKRAALIHDMPAIKPNTLNFLDIFKRSRNPVVISEIKFASPSCGLIYSGPLDHVAIASEYLSAGAAALSVLAEPHYFKGDINYIADIKAAHPKAHLLLKDFILSKKQIAQGQLYGANAVLLIAAFLDKNTLKELYNYSMLLGVTPVVEVHSFEELQQVLEFHPVIMGINNRNLETLETNLDTARHLIQFIPDGCYTLCESGIDHAAQMRDMIDLGFDGFLVGSSLMKHENPGIPLQQWVQEIQDES